MQTTRIQASQDATYAAAPKAQFLPEPGTPGPSGLGNFETLQQGLARMLQRRKNALTEPV